MGRVVVVGGAGAVVVVVDICSADIDPTEEVEPSESWA